MWVLSLGMHIFKNNHSKLGGGCSVALNEMALASTPSTTGRGYEGRKRGRQERRERGRRKEGKRERGTEGEREEEWEVRKEAEREGGKDGGKPAKD